MTCSICPSAKGPCSRCPVCLFEQTKDFPDENIADYWHWTPDDFITDIVSKDAKIARLQEQVEAQLAETQRAWNEREGEKRGRLAAEAERDRPREALEEFVDRDLSYSGGTVEVPCASHAAAIELVRRARAALQKEHQP